MTQTTIAVICNGLKGEFDPDKRLFYYPRRQKQKAGSGEEEEEGGVHNLSENADSSHSRLFTPTEFERHAGMAASKKWKYSVRVDLEAEPEIDWDAAALGPFTLGKWLEENGYGSGSRSGKSSSSKARGGGGTSHSNATSMSVGGHSHGYGSENYHKDKTPSDAAAGVNKSCPRKQWLSSPQLVLQQQQENGMGSQHAPAAATTRTTTTTTLNGNATRRLAEFEKFRLHDTSPRIGSAFQIEIPDCLCCKPQQDPDTLAHPEREGTILFESEEEARQSALGPEKAGADALPLSAIYDTDGASSDEESETIQREKSRRTRRRPKWLQGSVNMFTTEAEKEAMEKLEKLRPHHNHHHRGGHNNTSSNANSQGPDSTKQSVRTGGRKGGENLNLNEDDVTPRSKSRNPYFGAKGEKRQKKRWSDQKNSNDSSFKIGKIEKFGENEVLVLIVGRDGKKWTGSLRLVAEQRARKKAKASDDILGDNPRAAKAKRLLDQVTRMTERDSALKNLALMSDSASDEEVEEMVIEAQTEKGKARQQQQQLKQNAKSGLGGDLKAPPAGVSTKCATETVMVGGKVKTIHRGHGGRFASPNGPKAPSESENKHRVAGRPSQTNKSQEANANSIQQAMAAAAAAGLAAAQSQSLQQGAGGGEQAAQLLYYPPLMSQLNPAQQLSFMGMPGGWGPQFGFNQGMLSPEQFVKWNSMLASSAGMLQGQHSSAPVLQAPSNAQMNFPVNMGLMTMPHGRAPPGIPTNAIFQKNQQGHVFPPPPKMM